jgi:hypothetical protein
MWTRASMSYCAQTTAFLVIMLTNTAFWAYNATAQSTSDPMPAKIEQPSAEDVLNAYKIKTRIAERSSTRCQSSSENEEVIIVCPTPDHSQNYRLIPLTNSPLLQTDPGTQHSTLARSAMLRPNQCNDPKAQVLTCSGGGINLVGVGSAILSLFDQ